MKDQSANSDVEREEFLAQLEQMRQVDPEAFQKAMELIASSADPSVDRQALIEGITKLSSDEGSLKDVLLPGGKASLGSEGIKPKVYDVIASPHHSIDR